MENKIIEPTIFTNNKLFIQQLLAYKYLYVILVVLFLAGAYIYNHVAPKEWEVYATMSSTKNENSILLGNDLFRGMETFRAYSNIEDGINKLRSFSMVNSTIDELNLEIGYFCESPGIFKNTSELYLNSPFIVNIQKSHVQPINARFDITILSDSTYSISTDEPEATLFNYIDNEVVLKEFPVKFDNVYKFDEEINLNFMNLTVSKNENFQEDDYLEECNFYFKMYNPELITREYLRNFTVTRVSSSSSLLFITFRSENLEKAIYFVNNYLNFFIDENLIQKNTIARNTINFIDAQISGISDSLDRSESEITSYRSANQVMNLSYQAQTAYDNLQSIERERNDLRSQERYYTYILEYLRTSQDLSGVTPPSSMNVDNSMMNQLITELMDLNSERSNIISLRGEKNPFLAEIENRIKLQKQYVIEMATSNLHTVKQTLSDLDYRAAKFSKEIASLPRQELNMVNIQRKFNIDEQLYTYLLQKRSEATITMASTFPDFTLAEPARRVTSYQASPKYLFNYAFAFIMALLIPSAIMILKNLINFKINNPEYIQSLINKPPVATIFSAPEKTINVLSENPDSVSSESFRALRSTLFRKVAGNSKSKVILVTSAQPQDGKSFISLNLATSIAFVGMKTLLIDADLKRPILHKKLNIDNSLGASNYITDNVKFDTIISKTPIENLSFISSGPIIPNATEVIESGGFDKLIEEAKEKFDYIIIDTSPIGFMADAFLMTRYADQILLVARTNSTLKESFSDVITKFNSNNITNFDVILNDKDIKDSSHGSYSNYYIKEKKNLLKVIKA